MQNTKVPLEGVKNKIFEIAIEIDKLIKTSSTWKIENSQNSSWDIQAKLDVLSDVLVEKKLKELTQIKQIVSEEKDGIVDVSENWKYLIAYDPLDGSSLIDVNLSVWTIFGIYQDDFNWNNLVASFYIVYWPRLEVVFADENWVKFFRNNIPPFKGGLGGAIEERFEEIKMDKLEKKWKILSPWAKNNLWPKYHKNIINNFWEEWYKLRYSWWMVPDLHQIILKKWWLFTYPETTKNPDWKLRKLFEVFPFAFIFEKLWGWAIDKNWTRILDLKYIDLHETTSCYFWSKYEIGLCRDVLLKHPN